MFNRQSFTSLLVMDTAASRTLQRHSIRLQSRFFNPQFHYFTLIWKTGCVSGSSVSPGTQRSALVSPAPYQRGSFCSLHLHNMCFHLGLSCQYVSSTISTSAVTEAIT